MSRYIDAELIPFSRDYSRFVATEDDVDNVPTADVEEVRHGHWEVCGTFDDFLTCSVCKSNKYPFGYDFKYCPECGAKMDGERREENEG